MDLFRWLTFTSLTSQLVDAPLSGLSWLGLAAAASLQAGFRT